MRLDRLEIAGFKSFPERADLAFDRGVTAIVGPNGCGKSNVVDAITWVLGEQSAKSLRGDRMEDVIFNGSDARRPTGAAEVRLRLSGVTTEAVRRAAERRDGEETGDADGAATQGLRQMTLPATEARDIEVARRLYRSGESEYLIDGEVVRLRDVQDLLMDAGLGVKGYAVIEQGKIGQILGAKPTERRQLIEEAAGVTKYKSRRRAAELKLEAAQQNLTRVDDIVFELEKQRSALKRQAARARRYRKLREALRRWEKVLFARKYRVLAQAIDAARARLDEARAAEERAVGRVATLQASVDASRAELTAAEAEAAGIRDAVHARQLGIERRQQQLAFDRQQVEALVGAAGEIEADLEALQARREPARLELETRREAVLRAEHDRDEATGALAAEEDAYRAALQRIAAMESDLEAARGRVTAGFTAAAAVRNVIERAREARDRLAAEIARLEAEAGDLRIEGEHARGEREAASEALVAAREAIDRTRDERAGAEGVLAADREARAARARDLRERERELAALNARLRSLEELDAGREGYGEAARSILHEGAGGLDHLGSLADYLEAEPRYERAVEACLGDVLQAVVVRTHADAERGLAALRDRNLGRCGFLVLDGSPRHAEAEPVLAPPATVALGSVVAVGGPFAGTLRAALGGSWIAEHYDGALEAAASTPAPVATLAGDVFRGGCLVFGGGRAEARGILATKREIKELRERATTGQLDLDAAAGALAEVEARIAETERRLAALVSTLHEHEKVAVEHDLRYVRAADTLERLSRKAAQVDSERRRADEERRSLEAREQDAHESAARLALEQRELDETFASAQARLVAARESAADLGRRVADAKAAHATFSERAAALANEVARLEDAGAELEARTRARADERERNAIRRADLERAIDAGARELVVEQERFAAVQERARAAEEHVGRLQGVFAEGETTVRTARDALDDVRASVAQFDVARATAEADLAHLASSCLETVQASIEEVAAEIDALEQSGDGSPDAAAIYADEDVETDADETPAAAPADADTPGDRSAGAEAAAAGLAARALTAEEAIAELRATIDRLGPVNLMAIEQFDELEVRYKFLTSQRKDLVDSIASTGEAIKRIDRTTRERFREAYTAINQYFEETFTALFGGGRAGLVVLDEDDLLESGVDIIAQPPGKRLQSVQLLSGGEKALTAMALLFAMFRYRPSPFCLLDEIDAPLDDVNIGRFLEMLRGMLDRTQFIVITHSRKTMEMADRLYGVTMEEPGVSKLISLQLN